MTNRLPILVVEDDCALREAVCDTLELAGQTTISAAGGDEALHLEFTLSPDRSEAEKVHDEPAQDSECQFTPGACVAPARVPGRRPHRGSG